MARVPRLGDGIKKTNSLYYLKKAKQFCVQNDFSKAYENFVNYFESLNDPAEATNAVKTVFTRLVCKIGTVLEETNNVEELLKCYIQAINLFPNNYVILNNLGAYMFRVGEIDIARRYLELAVKWNRNYLPAEKNLMHLQWHELPRWHFRMLNDKLRNAAYEKAITTIVNKGYNNVIDVGAGCGLLSLYAAKNAHAQVTAIEENKILAKMCKDVLQSNDIKNVKIMNCYSTEITEPPDKCNLIVTETFDVALFGERALESIYHALTVLRTEEDFKIIPCRARIYIAAINCEELITKHKYIHHPDLNILNMQDICIKQFDMEPYEAEYLRDKNVKIMSDIKGIMDINLSNQSQIYQIINNDGEKKKMKFKCQENGTIHAIVVWFDLFLTEDIILTTNPLLKESVNCWEQAVFYLDHPVTLLQDDKLPITLSINDCKLEIATDTQKDHECYAVSKEIISFLNDKNLIASLIAVADKFSDTNLTVVDFNVFPLVGLLLAKNNCTVYHVLKNNNDRHFFEQLMTKNNIQSEKFTMISEDVPLEMDWQNQQSLFLFDVINTDGSLGNSSFKKKSEVISAIHLPKTIHINVLLISSAYIEYCNRVDDRNVLGFQIGKHINEYTGYEHPNLETFKFAEYSDPITFKFEKDGEKILPVTVKKTGVINALYTWYDIQFYEDIIFSTRNSSHYKKTCYFLRKWKSVTVGDNLNIKMSTDSTYLKFSVQ